MTYCGKFRTKIPGEVVFVYGTLLFPEVLNAVTGRIFPAQPAILKGYRRYKVKGQVFPGICVQPAAAVDGLVYWGVDDCSMQRLDDFESDFYQRQRLPVLLANGKAIDADVYVVMPAYEHLLSRQQWSPEVFERRYLRAYVRRWRGFCR